MKPEGCSPYSQAPATCPYPEPAQSSPHTLIPPPEGPSKYYPPIYAWVYPAVYPTNIEHKCVSATGQLEVLITLTIRRIKAIATMMNDVFREAMLRILEEISRRFESKCCLHP